MGELRRKYRGLFGPTARCRCPHSRLWPIYGDEINRVGGWRLFCADCGRYLAGPVKLAARRVRETRAGAR